jgi:hypothetical protein
MLGSSYANYNYTLPGNSVSFGPNYGGINIAIIAGNNANSSLINGGKGNIAYNNGDNFNFGWPTQQSYNNHSMRPFAKQLFHQWKNFHHLKNFKFPHQKQYKEPVSKPPVSEKGKPATPTKEKKCSLDYNKPHMPEKEKCGKPVNLPKCDDYKPSQPEKNCKQFNITSPARDYGKPVISGLPTVQSGSSLSGSVNNISGDHNTVYNITVNNNYFNTNFAQSA